ncbi:protoporphyrinogen oxidase isoform X2 [Poeciliopsis prolifica]|uniref:protoporphyrinogen oxidase isoform X2 n=1 Tax=Poeciliopsis prolifica TaxID=188132 RepID=UPI00241461E6|nr:protoporphyrinogen oxidase isoform X2 [Poeciliopsis prolifica]
MKTVAVLGGGIGGLAASFYLCKNPQVAKVIVLESSSRFGGWLWSLRRPDGAVFELGPRGIRPAGAVGTNTLNMVDDLGLEGDILPVSYNHVASKNRFLYVNGQLHKLPSGISGILKTVAPFSRPLLFSLLTELLVKKGREEDESIHSFVSRRLGKELADLAVDSLCRGVFAGDCKKLSVRSCFPSLHMAEQQRGSLTLGFLLGSGSAPAITPGHLAQRAKREAWAQWSLKRGVETLPESITEFLQQSGKVELHRDAAVKQIIPTTSGWKVHMEDGVISADHIMSALPAKALSCILPPSCQDLVQQLQDISTVTVAVASLEYEGFILPVTGFGHLVPSWEDPGLLGIVYDSVPFPQHNRQTGQTTRLTVMMGGAWFQNVFGAPQAVSADSLLARATEAVRCHLGHLVAPSWSHVALHRDCIPQYHLGHFQRTPCEPS